ncbi:MAG: hypothetical protein L6Q57_06140 [Alphaproteobacteria bacterium]|nr:hypothetical protein [Alphaproteobacteria bacterium]
MRRIPFWLVLMFMLAVPFAAHAQCLPGIPCITGESEDPATGPNAPKAESAACDADFMNQIYAVANLNAQRDMVMDQVLIRKPDSVLEYSCFDKLANRAAVIGGALFSETGVNTMLPIGDVIETQMISTQPVNVPSPALLPAQTGTTVIGPLVTYITNNFYHAFLGFPAGHDGDIGAGSGDLAYNCDFMNDVSFLARCENFGTDTQFFSLDWLAKNDPRAMPAMCTGGTGISQELINLAANKNFSFVKGDKMETYQDWLADPNACGPAIPTGIVVPILKRTIDPIDGTVRTTVSGSYQEHVCPNPQCFYDPGENACKQK